MNSEYIFELVCLALGITFLFALWMAFFSLPTELLKPVFWGYVLSPAWVPLAQYLWRKI